MQVLSNTASQVTLQFSDHESRYLEQELEDIVCVVLYDLGYSELLATVIHATLRTDGSLLLILQGNTVLSLNPKDSTTCLVAAATPTTKSFQLLGEVRAELHQRFRSIPQGKIRCDSEPTAFSWVLGEPGSGSILSIHY